MFRIVCAAALVACLLPTAEAFAEGETIRLFNGRDLGGWSIDAPALDEDPDGRKPFVVRDGLLVSLGTPGGHLVTDAAYEDYRLVVEYRFTGAGGNCGVLVHMSEPRVLYGMFPASIEVQMQSGDAGDFWCIGEDITTPDMERRRGPRDKWGTVEGNRRILNLTDGAEHALGEWNRMTIECVGDQVKVWVNGELVNHGHDATATRGKVALQAEGTEVEFRKVELTPIGEPSAAP
ncbi:DUF1080 domain-containing protein [Botrimarina sp.]|uniref:3-keto-disaccharide hydrolase n=1 Tax=Botrimarina sp. TaxID=2795802 RepID=UPI0032ED4734